MSTKLLFILALVAGAVAAVFVGLALRESPAGQTADAGGELIDAGRFVLRTNGAVVLDEEYTLFFHPADGYMLVSQATLFVAGEEIRLAQQTQYGLGFVPVAYQLAAETASGTQLVSAQMGIAGLTMEVRVGLSRQSAEVANVAPIALLDNNLVSHYVALLLALRVEALDRSFTAAIPQALLSLPAKADGPNQVMFRSGETVEKGKRFDLLIGDTSILLIAQDGRLVALINEAQGSIAYDVDRHPEGIELIAEDEGEDDAAEMDSRDVVFSSDGLTLAGTLSPSEEPRGPGPAVLFLHGSGPIDRDGNAPGLEMDAYRQLARGFSGAGIGSLRYDKRGVGESEGDARTASRDDLVRDARAAIAVLRAQPEADPTRVILVGHSEGAYLAAILAQEDPLIAGVVLLSGAARALDEITRWQVETLLRAAGAEEAQIAASLAHQDEYVAFVEQSVGEWADYDVAAIREALPWMTEGEAAALLDTPLGLSWLREHYLEDTEAILAGVTQPVLALHGDRDAQVPYEEAERIVAVLQAAGNADASALVLPELNHLLRHHPEEPNLVYRHLGEPVDPRVSDAVIGWILERFGP
ncbi:MAG: alpha/beta fold hydrolase [Candidatus Bipolaricaulota bacterium]|nr:MAG: alpha/beta fold hydrolase [Candidatus Bipolaricaulota bacterium]